MPEESMNSLERVIAAVKFQETDRVPVIAQVFAHAATLGGVTVDDYVRSGETLAQCQLDALRHYGYDAVFSVMDVSVETEAAGSLLRFRRNQYPSIERYALSGKDDWNTLSVPDPDRAGRMPEMLKALAILRGELGNGTLVVGCVTGPFTLATQLLGIEAALYLAIDDAPRLERLMDFATEVIIRFGLAQIEAGAHLPIVFDPSASPAVIPPPFFREFELPRLTRVFQAFSRAGALANWLHIAGPAGPILPYYPKAGVHIANFDYNVSAAEAGDLLPASCLDGNIKSLAFVESSPADIEAAAADLLSSFRDRRGFILSSGCEIPPESRPENIAAMVEAVRKNN
jgi:uroporphyrinogen decarboxylase